MNVYRGDEKVAVDLPVDLKVKPNRCRTSCCLMTSRCVIQQLYNTTHTTINEQWELLVIIIIF